MKRPYQQDAEDGVFREFSADRQSTLVVMPTGTGKTFLFGHVIRRWLDANPVGDVLVLAHREELIFQARAELAPILGFVPAVEMAEHTVVDGGLWWAPRCVIGSVQTMCRPNRLKRFKPDRFGLIVVDECFPAGTLVDGRPIETIRVGDTVTAVDERTGIPVARQVRRVYNNAAPRTMVRLTAGGRTVVCTENHPFYTGHQESGGWMRAADIVPGIIVYQEVAHDLHGMRDGVCSDVQSGKDVQAVGTRVLSDGVPRCGRESHVIGNNGAHEPQVCVGQNDGPESDATARSAGKGIDHAKSDGAWTSISRWERQADAGTGAVTLRCVGLAVRSCDTHEHAEEQRIPVVLQGRYRECGTEDSGRSGRRLSQAIGTAGAGPEKGCFLRGVRVDRVEVFQRPGMGEPDGLCPDGRVYNLEVEGEHTYFANGFLVHNCHHDVPQCKTYSVIREHFAAAKILGVTATPTRADKLALGQTYESVAYQYDLADAINDGWLVPVEQQFVRVTNLDFSVVGTVAGDLNQGQLDAQMRAKRALYEQAGAILKTCESEPTLIFTVSVNHGLELASIINDHKPGQAVCLHGGTDSDERRRQLERYGRGDYQYLLGCALFTEGFNMPRISRVVMARPTSSVVYYTQAIGRGTRTLRGVLSPDMVDSATRRAAIAASAKPRVVVLDFVGNSGKHKLISAVDVLAGRHAPAAVERVKKVAEMGPVDIQAALDQTEKDIAREEREAKERKERLAQEKRTRLNARADVSAVDVDPFDRHATAGVGRKLSKASGNAPASIQQTAFIQRHGIWKEGMTVADAARAIADIRRRWDRKLCSQKQARQLKKFGHSPDTPRDFASLLLDIINQRGWRGIPYPLTRDRFAVRQTSDGFRAVVRDDVKGPIAVGPVFDSQEKVRNFVRPHLTREMSYVESVA